MIQYADGLQRIQPGEGTNVLGPPLAGEVSLNASPNGAGSELRMAIWSGTRFYVFLSRTAACKNTATVVLFSIIFH